MVIVFCYHAVAFLMSLKTEKEEVEMAGEICTSVQGLQTLCGGTRTSVKVDRPWQPKMVFPTPNPCPFCTKQQEDEYKYFQDDYCFNFKAFQNSNTPFPYHRLLIPTECWDEKTLRDLGGKSVLKIVLRCALEEIKRTRKGLFPTWIYTHVGYGAGQNLTHNHWHLCGAPTEPNWLMSTEEAPDNIVLDTNDDFLTIVCGVKAGQVLIGNKKEWTISSLLTNHQRLSKLIYQVYFVVNLFNKKFNYPDYCLFFAFNPVT